MPFFAGGGKEELKEQAQELLQECVRCAQELEEFDMVLN